MMQHQDIEAFPSGSESEFSETSELSVFDETHNATNYSEEDTHLVIDFENVEDILDFSVQPLSETANRKKRKQRKKLIATDPVKLLELKPKIDNYVNDGGHISENHEASHETEPKSKRRFQCIYCGSKFVRSTHLHRHLRIHTGVKPYVCPVCRKRFSRSDYQSAHVLLHRREKIHHCCVCGKAYFDLTRFAHHCRTHDDSEYIKLAMGTEHELLRVEDEMTAAAFREEIEEIFSITIEKVDNSTTEERITYVENPLYLYMSHHPIITINIKYH